MKENYYDLDSKTFRFFQIIPGLLTILIITSPIWLPLLGLANLLFYFIAFLSVYWLYKTVIFNFSTWIGYNRMRMSIQTNWVKKIKKMPKAKKIYHMVLIPYHKEPFSVLDKTVAAIKNSDYPYKERIFVVIGVEERAGIESLKNVQKIQKKYKNYFADLRYYVHPKDLPNEVVGIAGANLRWAARHFVKEIKKEGYNLADFLMTKHDSDLIVHPKFYSALTHKYLTTENRKHRYFTSAVLFYSNNYWTSPILTRIWASVLTLAIISEWVAPLSRRAKRCFSLYCINLETVEKVDYWDPRIGVDDTGIFHNAFLALNGDFSGKEIYIPTYSDIVESTSTLKTYQAFYKQRYRWSWGVISYPMTMQGILRNNKIPLIQKIDKMINLFFTYNYVTTMAFLLTFAIPIASLVYSDLSYIGLIHTVPKIMSWLLNISLVGMISLRIVIEKFYGPPPKEKGVVFWIWHFFEQFLVIINRFTFDMATDLHAQVEMLLGKSMVKKKFYVAEKRAD